ncbi:hypothetical protein IFVP408_C2110221 [Vibrio parahaemolyticus]
MLMDLNGNYYHYHFDIQILMSSILECLAFLVFIYQCVILLKTISDKSIQISQL